MAWYYGTYSCGHEGRVNIVGPEKHRQWKVDRHFEALCEECYEKKLIEDREKANAEAAKKAKEMELPELKGTEKQVAWANTLRQKRIEEFEREIEDHLNPEQDRELYSKLLDYMLSQKTQASWYIENRRDRFQYIEEDLKLEMAAYEKSKKDAVLTEDINAEATVYPENAITNVVVEIGVDDNKVHAIFKKNDTFREIVKSLGFKWRNAWERDITETTGKSEDRAAEFGNVLLNAGFPIRILNNEARQKAIDGSFEPECKRWIYLRRNGDYDGWLAINWEGQDDRLYKVARALPSSKWSRPSVVVRVEHFEEIEEFAKLYGFRFTTKAQETINAYRKHLEQAKTVIPAVVEKEAGKDGLAAILESSREVLPDLLDED